MTLHHKNMMNTKAPIRYLNKTYNKAMLNVLGTCLDLSHASKFWKISCYLICIIPVTAFSCKCAKLSGCIVFHNVLSVFLEWVHGAENRSSACLERQQCHYSLNLIQKKFLHEANLPFCTCFIL